MLSSHSAAVLLGADCAPEDAPAEVTVPRRWPSGSTQVCSSHRSTLAADDVRPCRGVLVSLRTCGPATTSATARLVDAVVGIDALANVCRYRPHRHPRLGAPPSEAHRAVATCDEPSRWLDRARRLPYGDSPAVDPRCRAVSRRPRLQYPVLDYVRRRSVWLDLALPGTAHRHRVRGCRPHPPRARAPRRGPLHAACRRGDGGSTGSRSTRCTPNRTRSSLRSVALSPRVEHARPRYGHDREGAHVALAGGTASRSSRGVRRLPPRSRSPG